jgi:hypothetical protein
MVICGLENPFSIPSFLTTQIVYMDMSSLEK